MTEAARKWEKFLGTSLEKGTVIDIKVSGGEMIDKTIDVPLDDATYDIVNISITVSDENGKLIWSGNESRSKTENGGVAAITIKGSGKCTVKIYFDNNIGKSPIYENKIDF